MQIVLLDRATLGNDINLDCLRSFGDLKVYDTTNTKSDTKDRIEDADIVITNKVIIDREVMESSKKLKLICVAATGMNNIDLEAAKELKIEVKNVTGYSTYSVVQHTFGMLFYLLEGLSYYDEYVKNHKWEESDIFTHLGYPFWEIFGKKWGIIGLGTIGKEVAKVAKAFGCDVCYFSTSGTNDNSEYKRVELDYLLRNCDIISIHAPLNEKTKNLLSYNELKLLKEPSALLNLGRGGIINEIDLAQIIEEKEIFVGLDVLENEPIKRYNPLNFIKNKHRLLITPHIAWSSKEARVRLVDGIAKNISMFLNQN